MEKVYKSLLGYVDEDKVYSYTHVVLEKNEYKELVNQLNEYKEKLELQRRHRQDRTDLCEQIDNIEDAREEIARQVTLNKNLLRINKERANADRELRPKKEHTGYVLLASQQYDMIFGRTSTVGTIRELVWKTWIQTPYDASMSFNLVYDIVEKELSTNLSDKLGIYSTYISYKDYVGSDVYYENSMCEMTKKNVIFNTKYKANYKEGYWEVEFQHLYELTVPLEMRVCKKKNKRNHQ